MLEHEMMWQYPWWSSVFHSWVMEQQQDRPILWTEAVAWEKLMEMEDVTYDPDWTWDYIIGSMNEN